MAIEMGGAAKAVAGLCLVGGGGVGAYYGYSYLKSGKSEAGTGDSPAEEKKVEQTKYDKALINFLKETNNDIIFEVKKGDAFSEDLGDTLEALTQKIKVRVKVSTTTKDKFKVGSAAAEDTKIGELKKHNADKDWTWSCEFEFKKADGATKANIDSTTKDKIVGASNKGLFGILKKDVNAYTEETGATTTKWKKAELKAVKTKFVQECSKARTNNKEIEAKAELDSSEITVKIPAIEFKDQGDNLVANDAAKFGLWFQDNYGTKEYHSA